MRVLITGASQGLGYELCKHLKASTIHCIDIVKPQQELQNVTYHKLDIRSEETIKLLSTLEEFDLIINNAGVMRRGTISEISLEDFKTSLEINVLGSWLISRYAKLSLNGQILFINSRHGLDLKKDPAIYSLTKKSLNLLAELFRKDKFVVKEAFLGPFKGGVSQEGHTKEEYAKRELSTPSEIANLIIKLIESSSKTRLIYDENKKVHYLE